MLSIQSVKSIHSIRNCHFYVLQYAFTFDIGSNDALHLAIVERRQSLLQEAQLLVILTNFYTQCWYGHFHDKCVMAMYLIAHDQTQSI